MKNGLRHWKAFVGLVVIIFGSNYASAGLIGQTLTHECPQCGPPYSQSFLVTEGAGPELTPFNQWELDVEDSTIMFTFLINGPLINPLDLIVRDILGGIQNVTVDPSSTVLPVGISFDQQSITIDFSGGPGLQQGEFWLLNVDQGSQVPVPTTIALFVLGLAGLNWSRRKTA